MSANTGVAPAWEIASAEAMKLFAAVMTSSPGPISYARKANSRADVPESTPTANCTSQKRANSSSNKRTSRPRMKSVSRTTLETAASISCAILAYCAARSTNGTCDCGVCIRIVLLYLHLLSFVFDRPAHRFQHANYLAPLDPAADGPLAQPHAFQKVAALVFEGLGWLDARADDVAVANLKAELAVVQRLFLHRA